MKTLSQFGIYLDKTRYTGIGIVPKKKGYIKITRILAKGHSYAVVCMVVAVGKCSTDKALASGQYGAPAFGYKNIITGHEVVLRVIAIIGDSPHLANIKVGGYYMMVVRQPRVWPCTMFDLQFPPVDLDSNDSNWGEAGLSFYDGGDRPIMVCDARAMIPIPEGIKPQQAVLIETASCPAKGQRLAEAYHAAAVGGIENVDTHLDPMSGQKLAIILGVTGACGLIEAAQAALSGYQVIGIGRKEPDHPRVQLVHQLGITYVQDDGKDPNLVAKTVKQHGYARFIFDTTANPYVVDRWEAAGGPTSVTMEFGIPEHCCFASKQDVGKLDLSYAPKGRTIGTKIRAGTINASVREGDWTKACQLLEVMSVRVPHVLSAMTRCVDGFDVPLIEEYIGNPDIIKPVVLPNGWGAMSSNPSIRID